MFFTLEGSEGAGKSTLIEHLKKYFLDRNIEFIFTKEPGGTEEGAKLRKLLIDIDLSESTIIDFLKGFIFFWIKTL